MLVSPYDPAAGFNVGHAMQRNKLIYALSDAALVVTSDFEKGGTWAGAIEQLERLQLVPVFVRNSDNAGKGNTALLKRGGIPWPNPQTGLEFKQAIAVAFEHQAAKPQQHSLLLILQDDTAVYNATPTATPLPEQELFTAVKEILRRELVVAKTEEEAAALLVVSKTQAKSWLTRLLQESLLEIVANSKPARYRST